MPLSKMRRVGSGTVHVKQGRSIGKQHQVALVGIEGMGARMRGQQHTAGTKNRADFGVDRSIQ
jgi:hypothetical protein